MNKKLLILISVIFGAILIGSASVYAQSTVGFQFEDNPLFNEANFLPNDSVTRWVKVTNNSGEAKPIATEAINWPGFSDSENVPSDDLSRALEITIRIKGGSDLYGGTTGIKTLFNFYENGETFLSNASNGVVTEYEFQILFPSEKENEWQEKSTFFDILVGVQGEEGGGDDDDDNSGGGGGGSPLPPGLTIFDEAAEVIGCCDPIPEATVTWNTNYHSTSQVVYGTTPGVFDLLAGPSNNYGYDLAAPDPEDSDKVKDHSVTLTGLLPNTTYYYRCVSHASPVSVGKEHSFEIVCLEKDEEEKEIPVPITPGPEYIPGPGPEYIPGPVADIEISPDFTPDDFIEPLLPPEEGPEVEASAFVPNFLAAAGNIFGNLWNVCYPCFPWWSILILAGYCLLQAFVNKKKDKEKIAKWIILAIPLVILAAILYFVNYRCIAMWLLLLLVSLIFVLWRLWIYSEKNVAWPEYTEKERISKKIKKDKILLLGIIILLILFIIYFILGCLYPWIIIVAFIVFLLGSGLIKRKKK
ncbi:MAG: fibronectin type III domain-containing protein [Patescibacteria group bacterium]|nr:fibronectin type III domain-containing protein [Patescibacteria group bacterium]